MQPGDYVFIQFGHNDEQPEPERHTESRVGFRQNLINYIEEIKGKGAWPVLFTAIPRRQFDSAGVLQDTHGDYITVVREIAMEKNVSMVDLNKKFSEVLQRIGPKDSKKLFVYIEPGKFQQLPEGKKDDNHLSLYGAKKVAALAVQGIKELNLRLVKYLK